MTIFAWVISSASLFCAGWYARGLWDAIDESQVARDMDREIYLAKSAKDYWQERL